MPASTICDARSRADGVTIRLRMPDGIDADAPACPRKCARPPASPAPPDHADIADRRSETPSDNGWRENSAAVFSTSRTRSTCQPSTSVPKSSPSICSRPISRSPISTLETSSAPSLSAMPGHQVLGRGCANIVGALLATAPRVRAHDRSRRARSDSSTGNAVTRHHRAELVTGRIPADVPAFEHGDAGAHPRRFPRHRQPGKPGPDDADIDVEIERQPATLGRA